MKAIEATAYVPAWKSYMIFVDSQANGLRAISYIHTYIIGPYNLSVRITDLVSHTSYIVCVNFTHKWRDLKFKVAMLITVVFEKNKMEIEKIKKKFTS